MTRAAANAVTLADALRSFKANTWRNHGITVEGGAPTVLPDGLHVAAVEAADLETIKRLPPQPGVLVREVIPPARLPVFEAANTLRQLHSCDITVRNGFIPTDETATLDFGSVIAVLNGYAIGHLLLFDSSGTPGQPYDLNRVPSFDTLSNVWVAHDHRRRGVAASLLAYARSLYPLVELQRPFTSGGAAWARACAPDMLSVGRNDPCPCGSGAKFKRCHTANLIDRGTAA